MKNIFTYLQSIVLVQFVFLKTLKALLIYLLVYKVSCSHLVASADNVLKLLFKHRKNRNKNDAISL